MIAEVVAAVLLLTGAAFVLVAAIGLLRMPDLLMRLHATSKAGTLGAGLMLAGVAVYHDDFGVTSRVVVTIAFIILTGPVSAHIIARSGFFQIWARLWEGTLVNELGEQEGRGE